MLAPLPKKSSLYKLIIAILVLFAFLYNETDGASSYITFNYFNPDSPQNNLEYLKREVDGYLIKKGVTINFQPFTHLADLHRQNIEHPPSFLLVPDWYYQRYAAELGLKNFLVPERNGTTSYKKVFLAASNSPVLINDYKVVSIATTPMGPENESTAINFLLNNLKLDRQQLNIVHVPKDLDAILALVLGQVELALVTKDNLQNMTELNARLLQSVKEIEECDCITVQMPVFCYLKNRVDLNDVKRLRDIFLEMSSTDPQNKLMEMLHIDRWKAVTE